VLALAVALGPIVGYVWSRSIGMPDYSDDIGNWTEPLGVASLIVEGLLLICAIAALAAVGRRSAPQVTTASSPTAQRSAR